MTKDYIVWCDVVFGSAVEHMSKICIEKKVIFILVYICHIFLLSGLVLECQMPVVRFLSLEDGDDVKSRTRWHILVKTPHKVFAFLL